MMNRPTALLMAMILCFGLEACGMKTELEPDSQGVHTQVASQEETENTNPESSSSAAQKEPADAMEEPIQLDLELIGPWHLDQSRNDLTVFADSLDLFPGFGEWGASMEIRGNGEMSWYIGSEGWNGTYSVENNILHTQLTSDSEQISKNWDLRITAENGTTGLEMDYKDMTIYWAYGDQEETASGNTVPSDWEKATEDEPWKAALAEDLFEKYGVLPEYYEDLGDGIYQVYVEVGGEIVPFVTVNSATGDYHG